MSNENLAVDDVVLKSLMDTDNIELHFECTDDGNRPIPGPHVNDSVDDGLTAVVLKKPPTSNPTRSSTLRRKASLQCGFCRKTFTAKSNLHRHKKLCKLNTEKKNIGFNCLTCGKTISRSDNFSKHQRICSVKTERHMSCWHCSSTFYRKSDLIEHLEFQHGSEIKEKKELTFPNFVDFKKWKEGMEECTFSYFSKRSGNTGNVSFYYCQQDGNSKPHRKKGDKARQTSRQNKKGQIRRDKICIAYIRVQTEKNGSLKVTYQPTHCHLLDSKDYQHHPLSTETENYIDKQLELGISPMKIAASLINLANKCSESGKPSVSKNNLVNILTRIRGKLWRRQARMKENSDATASDKEKQRTLKLATTRAAVTANIKRLSELVKNESIPYGVLTKIKTATTDLLKECQAITHQHPNHDIEVREI